MAEIHIYKMKTNPYIGHEAQLWGVEEVRLQGGKGDGMRLLNVYNGAGLRLSVAADRCADIVRLSFKGDNFSYMSPCGFVGPSFYDGDGAGFLKSFTGGFLTTCGLTNVGCPCEDGGETLPMHGTIGNTPAEHVWWEENDEEIIVHARVNDGVLFGRKLVLERTITVGKYENRLSLYDSITNMSDVESPLMVLYHMNMGYPLLSEKTELTVNSMRVEPRDEVAAAGIDSWDRMLPPTPWFAEQCFYHTFDGEASVRVYNPDIRKGLELSFDSSVLDHFVEWKMMGVRDYVLGLEPGICGVGGRDLARESGELRYIAPAGTVDLGFSVRFFER
ncbi:MAG: aldose 1-epimerase family protein [Bacteroidales bacterium]|nr:aldose 1-epimerase family protein [Bacteroidales bacterium]